MKKTIYTMLIMSIGCGLYSPANAQNTSVHVEGGQLIDDAEVARRKHYDDSVSRALPPDQVNRITIVGDYEGVGCGPMSCDEEVGWLITQLLASPKDSAKLIANSVYKFAFLIGDINDKTLIAAYKTINDLYVALDLEGSGKEKLAERMQGNILRELWARMERGETQKDKANFAAEFSKQTGKVLIPEKRRIHRWSPRYYK